MELIEAMRHAGTTRYYSDQPVSDEVLQRAFEAARFAPNGGNRQPTRWIVVRDPEQKRKLVDLYLPHWKSDLEQYLKGTMTTLSTLDAAVAAADHFAEHFHEVPAILVACARLADLHPGALDEQGRPNMVAGASIYPFVENVCLALRDAGVGTTITTLICLEPERERELLGLPDDVVSACHVAAGYPVDGWFPKRLKRLAVEETTFLGRYGEAWPGS